MVIQIFRFSAVLMRSLQVPVYLFLGLFDTQGRTSVPFAVAVLSLVVIVVYQRECCLRSRGRHSNLGCCILPSKVAFEAQKLGELDTTFEGELQKLLQKV